jgi:hypothetical protein
MDPHVMALLAHEGALAFDDFNTVMAATDTPVDWAYDVWDDLVKALHSKEGGRRAVASQVLCNLAKSDPDKRMLRDFDAVFAITRDAKFVTARHCLQSIWKVAIVSDEHCALVVDRLAKRFADCASEKNATLIRYDIVVNLFKIYEATHDDAVKQQAQSLIETEGDIKYRKKYAGVWRAAS